MTHGIRLGYVIGHREGVVAGMLGYDIYKNGEADRRTIDTSAFNTTIENLDPAGMSNGECVRAIDRFYEEPLNARIAVSSAIQIVTQRAKGGDEAAIEEHIRLLQQMIAATEETGQLN
jgi:hypothetical protein